ncbi:hypothetical protein PInf_004023 [Phytophthora infestans]|nr:hypothetical protein PInf_004023 [Phytophthora infestans]
MEVEEMGAALSATEDSLSSKANERALRPQGEAAEAAEAASASRTNKSTIEHIEPEETNQEAELARKEEVKVANAAAVAVTRKKELKELQARAEAAREKQQAAASVLARSLKHLRAKRKREEKEADEHQRKKISVEAKDKVNAAVAAPEMHPFATAPALDVGTAELAKSTCFRIATRYLTQTGLMISREQLEQVFKTYTGKALEEVVEWSYLEHSLTDLVAGDIAKNVHLSNAARRSVCWQPGRQSLKTPTFISSDAGRIQTLIELEKDIVASVCDSLRTPDTTDNKSAAFMRKRRQILFLANLLPDGAAIPTLSGVLSACVGVNSTTSSILRTTYRSHGQIAGVLDRMEAWLREQAEMAEPQSSLSPRFDGQGRSRGVRGVRELFFSSKHAKLFSVTNDSVVRQLRGGAMKSAGSKKIDFMKVLCHYELNGVCNDKNCSNYHQKDYESVVSESSNLSDCSDEDVDGAGLGETKVDEMDQLLVSFAEFRARIMPKWPVITTAQTSSATERKNKDGKAIAPDATLPSRADAAFSIAQEMEGKSEEDNGDFIVLDSREELPDIGEARYFDDINSRKVYGEKLQASVEENPSATEAWLLLAIHQLDLDIGLGDEAVNLSDDDLLQRQLLFLCKELNLKQRSDASQALAVDEANLKQCLHTLSRALEVEANAYCEALWLLYLRLCRQVTNRQTEIDMVEQGVQFLPNSHALWLRYISTYEFDSVGMAEGIYWRLLEHLARTNSAEVGSQTPSATKEVSILLTAICCHLCIKLWHAGATSRVLELLSALLQLDNESSEFAWCTMVRARLRGDEVVVICLFFAHILLFKELPALMEHWVAASNNECVPIKGLSYTAEYLRGCNRDFEKVAFTRAFGVYELAFQTLGNDCDEMLDAGNVILGNWMLLLALQQDFSKKNEPLSAFFREYVDKIPQYPSASLTAAKLMGLTSTGEKQAYQLMLTMMNRNTKAHFPEALHHYLFACRQSPALVDALDKTFPDVMKQLATLLDVDTAKVEKSIQDIMHVTSKISKSRALKDLLDTLLGAWMDQLALLRRGSSQPQSTDKQTKSLADIYVGLDIVHLMGLLLEPSVAIDGIQMMLSLLSFGILSLEARQLAWMQRFVFQVDCLQQEDLDSASWRKHQAMLTQLFRKYMAEMSVETEMMRQVSTRIKRDITNRAIEDAVRDCLSPERSHLITYDVHLELFQLCSAAIAGPEKAAFYASCTDMLAMSSEFSLAFSDIATHEWELLAARASLRRCLKGAKTQHPQVLQALVAVELRLRNMKAVSSLLEAEMQANPLLLESWRLAVGLEILLGEKLSDRSKTIAEEMERRQLVFACNTFGDEKLLDQKNVSWCRYQDTASLSLRGLGLEYVPNAVLLQSELISLNVSGNELMELPMALRQLKNLQELDASENSLLELPACVNNLTKLRELRLAHNNVAAIAMPTLPQLNVLDISWNAVTHLRAADIDSLTKLKILQAEENQITSDELSKISDLLSQAAARQEGKPEDVPSKQPSHSLRSESSQDEVTNEAQHARSAEAKQTSFPTEDVSAMGVSADDGDQVMEEEHRSDASKSIEVEREETVASEQVDSTGRADDVDNVIIIDDNDDAPSESKENDDGDQVMAEQDTLRIDTPSTTESNAMAQGKEVIEIDSPRSTEGENETTAPEARLEATRREESIQTATSTDVQSTSIGGGLGMEGVAEAEDFAQSHTEVVAAALVRRQSSHDAAANARRKLTAYMDQNQIDNRADVRRRNPKLWREFVAASLPVNVESPAYALLVLKERSEPSEAAEEFV